MFDCEVSKCISVMSECYGYIEVSRSRYKFVRLDKTDSCFVVTVDMGWFVDDRVKVSTGEEVVQGRCAFTDSEHCFRFGIGRVGCN